MKKLVLLIALGFWMISGFFNKASATHYMGGEITWECMKGNSYTLAQQGRYRFHLKLYRECYTTGGGTAATFGATESLSTNVPGLPTISMALKAGWPKDLSPTCYSTTINIKCTGMTNPSSNRGAVQEYYYTSDGAYPNGIQLTGVPPASGWIFYNSSCCRNPATNIVNADAEGWRLRAIMYPYLSQNTYPCFDNSPTFAEVPRTVICSGYPFTYNHNAFDKELDELLYEWGQPLDDVGGTLNYSTGYSYTNPLPSPTQNPLNVASNINPNTGEISFTSYTTGAFVTSTKVKAYRCGVKVAEIWRDMQVTLLPCGSNTPPSVTPPFFPNSYIDTVYAGDYVQFSMSATDFQMNPNNQPQVVRFEATGSQFGAFVPAFGSSPAHYSDTNGCLNKPCATLSPAPGPNNTYPLQSQFAIATSFGWQTKCTHLQTQNGCNSTTNVYNFIIKASDDYCPAPAYKISTITIVVVAKPTLPSPAIQCVKVLPNGKVELNWTPNRDTLNTFGNYYIYRGNTPTALTLIDSVMNIAQGFYVDNSTAVNANNSVYYYSLRTKAGCPGIALVAPAKDTVSTIKIDVSNATVGGATLSWNPIRPVHLPSSTKKYDVWREYPTGSWVKVGTTPNTSYFDTITVCRSWLNYKVEIADTNLRDTAGVKSTCYSVSSIDGDTFKDATAPIAPLIDSVSINATNSKATISWDINQNKDTEYYIIYMFVNNAWTPIDTVYGINNHTFTDLVNDPCSTGPNYYRVAAADSCDNKSAMSEPQNTLFLDAKKSICDDKITLKWNTYQNMPNGIAGYNVLMSENSSPFTILAALTPGDTIYDHIGLNDGSTYCYKVQAVSSNGITSTSCKVCEVAIKPNQPQFSYIRWASVLPTNNAVDLTFHTDVNAKVSTYRIERLNNSVWMPIGNVAPNTAPTLSYIDNSAIVRQQSHTYRVVVVDSCGDDAKTSNLGKSIYLKVKANTDLTNTLTWSPYGDWNGTPTEYFIYRKVDNVADPLPIGPVSTFTYIDQVDQLGATNGIFDYYIVAVEGAGNIYNFQDSARSNEVRVHQKPKLYVPSAFNPNSTEAINRIFRPISVYANSKDYTMLIFNRWGKQVFKSTNAAEGWDGSYEGAPADPGVYTYLIRFTTSEGVNFEKSGTLTLIR